MAVSDVEAVLQFLRKNGFSEAESALKEDILDKADLGSFDYDKFFFPMMPPPPPLRIPSSTWRSDAPPDNLVSSKSTSRSSEDDDFVSLGSSTSGLCSSEFTNPYGIQSTSRCGSEASSRLSQFDTARDYYDFDMQTDLWYNESDEGNFMTPNFDGQDFFSSHSEDKFIMTLETDKQQQNTVDLNFKYELYQSCNDDKYLDKGCVFDMPSTENRILVLAKDYCHVDEMNQSEEGFNGKTDDPTDMGGSYEGHKEKDVHPSLEEIHLNDYELKTVENILPSFDYAQENKRNHIFDNFSSDEQTKYSKGSAEFSKEAAETFSMPSYIDNYEAGDGGKLTEEFQKSEASEDELLSYNSQDSGYEVFDLRIIHRKNRTGFEENKEFPIVLNTVIAGRYYITEYLGSAAFSKVVQARDLLAGMDVCLKIIKNDKDFFDQSLDEIKLLKLVNKSDPSDKHHILRLYDYFYHQEHLFIVCELLRANLYEFQKFNQESGGEVYFTMRRLQIIARQCLEALDYLHGLGIIHCDLKPENILIKNYRRCEIKVIDLGSSCFQSDNLCLYVQSRSYRAPEVILGLPYDKKIDIWSLGCILAELSSGEVLFANDAVVMILARMIGMLGPIDLEMLKNGQETHKYFTQEYDLYHINEETNQLECIIPEESSLAQHVQVHDIGFINFVRYLLRINPKRRPTAKQALEHPWLSRVYDSK